MSGELPEMGQHESVEELHVMSTADLAEGVIATLRAQLDAARDQIQHEVGVIQRMDNDMDRVEAARDAALERAKHFGDALNDEVDLRRGLLARAEKAEAALNSAEAYEEKWARHNAIEAQLASAQAVIDAAQDVMAQFPGWKPDSEGNDFERLRAALAAHLQRYPKDTPNVD